MLISASANLYNKREKINQLNVFPVPDGDTGSNMSMSFNSAVKDLNISDNASTVADAVASGLLRGARGNSGVILSLLFRGFSKSFKGKSEVNAVDFSTAFAYGVEAAYSAVMRPTEGTILTVARVMSEELNKYISDCESDDFSAFFEFSINAAKDTLSKTPDMLPVLKQAGVVDAGGYGFIIALEGMYSVIKDGVVIERSEDEDIEVRADFNSIKAEDITFTYCTEFIVHKNEKISNKEISKLKEYIAMSGDSLVFVDSDGIIKIHIHTDNPGKVIERALSAGALSAMKIENMRIQHDEMIRENTSDTQETDSVSLLEKKYGFIAVASGEGFDEIFKGFAVDYVVSGGQTMNPSTEDILSGIYSVNAQNIYILPNNKNIILAAEMAANVAKETTDKNVFVIPSKTLPQGISAIMNFDESVDAESNFDSMKSALDLIHTGQMTYAVRDSIIDDHIIKNGQVLGMIENHIEFVGDDLCTVACNLMSALCEKCGSAGFISVYYGSDISEDDANIMITSLTEKTGIDDIALFNGGQPVYPYILSVE